MKDFNKIEQNTAERAKMYLQKLIQGINPIDDSEIKDDSVVANDRIKRCFKYIVGVLEVYEEALEAEPGKRHIYQKKMPFDLTAEDRGRIPVTEEFLKITEFAKHINTLIDENFTKPLKGTAINKWLLRKGFLEDVVTNDGKHHKWPTKAGLEIGIKKEKFLSKTNFPYYVVLYGRQAQQFIADNIGEIIDINNEPVKRNKSKKEQNTEKLLLPESGYLMSKK